MPDLIPVLNKDDIAEKVAAVARRISIDYKDRDPIFIGVLKGAFIFLSDLVRNLTIPVKVDFIGVSSYRSGTSSTETIRVTKEIEIDLKGKEVLIVEDIVDTGLTLTFLIDYIKSFNPWNVSVCAMIDKRERRQADVEIDYVCQVVNEGFLVGYGLDYAEEYRGLPEIYQLKL